MSTLNTSPIGEDVTVLRFPHSKEELRRITVKDATGEYEVYRMAPVVAEWPAGQVPDDVNPRSHDEQCLKSSVAKAIEETLREFPEDFWLANRGGYLLAERVKFDPAKSVVEIVLANRDIHGMADGATTNTVIAKLQKELQDTSDEQLAEALSRARFNLDVVVGLQEPDRIAKLVAGRNRSVQVREWSLADFKGQFDWLKAAIERPGGPFNGRIGWEENAGLPFTVLDVISLMTLFHPAYGNASGRRKAPTVAFSSKGTADRRLIDEKMAPGYQQLRPVLEDILTLHDYVHSHFDQAYERYNKEYHNKGSKLGKRKGVESKKMTLPLTGMESEYRIDKGLLFPLLNALRALLKFDNGNARWAASPQDFFDRYGFELMSTLIEHYELARGNPATVGKTALVYTALYNQAQLFLGEMLAD